MFVAFNVAELVRNIGERLRGERQCRCGKCLMPTGRTEVYVWCPQCNMPVESSDGASCGICGAEAVDRAPEQFYHRAS
jgi:hypothetical protein